MGLAQAVSGSQRGTEFTAVAEFVMSAPSTRIEFTAFGTIWCCAECTLEHSVKLIICGDVMIPDTEPNAAKLTPNTILSLIHI